VTFPLILIFGVIVTAVVSHIIYCRLFGSRSTRSPQKILLAVIIVGNFLLLAGLISQAVADGWLYGVALLAYSLIVYNAAMYAYFHLFNMSETARRIRILLNILEHGALRNEDILAGYTPRNMVTVRLERLVLMGWLQQNRAGQYKIKARWALYTAQTFRLMRKILGFAAMKEKV
jgi:hypothetical protein